LISIQVTRDIDNASQAALKTAAAMGTNSTTNTNDAASSPLQKRWQLNSSSDISVEFNKNDGIMITMPAAMPVVATVASPTKKPAAAATTNREPAAPVTVSLEKYIQQLESQNKLVL